MAMEHFFRHVGNILGTLRAEYRQIANRYFGKVERFDGDARAICQQILDRLWEGDFYRTSLGHFDFFWMRDFGTVAQSLVRLGHKDRVHHTLHWALRYYRRAGTVTLCIDKSGNTFNAPARSIDALPWLLHSIVASDYPLKEGERYFIERQLRKYSKVFLDKKTGLIKDMVYAEMRDAVIYDRSAYSYSLVARMAECVEYLGMQHAFPRRPQLYREELLNHYWNGNYFNADYWNGAFSAECALFPFWLGGIHDENKMDATFKYIDEHRLNYPYPLKYTDTPKRFKYRWWMSGIFMSNYQGEAIWSWHGEYYLHLLKRYKRREYKEQYKSFSRMIERHGNFPEMLDVDGTWFHSLVYKSDPGMVWVALFLELPMPD